MTANVLILAGYGLNCEEETLHAFEYNGLKGQIRHINDLIENPKELESAQILAIPGGFSYGDDTGSGNGFAQKMKLALWEALQKFVARDTLTIGICNGCQILSNLGMVPGFDGKYGERLVAVTHNETARYQCRWIDIAINENNSPWLEGIERMHIPVAHGEGRFMMSDDTLARLKSGKQIGAQFIKPPRPATAKAQAPKPSHPSPHGGEGGWGGEWELANGEFPYNPNGAVADIAALTDETGRVLAIMPHPERGMFNWQRDDYDRLKDTAQREGRALPEAADGMAIFKNAARYFEVAQKSSKKQNVA